MHGRANKKAAKQAAKEEGNGEVVKSKPVEEVEEKPKLPDIEVRHKHLPSFLPFPPILLASFS